MRISRLLKDKTGATAIEYGLIVALIALAIAGTLKSTGNAVSDQLNRNANAIINLTK